MRSKLVRFQLIVFTVVAVLAVGNAAVNYLGLKRVTGIGMYTITAEFDRAGGLYVNSLVTYRGVDVGVVKSIDVGPDRASAELQLDSDFAIPANSRAFVRSVSAIGEQYLDMVPASSEGPFLADGDVITKSNTEIPVPASEVVDKVNVLLSELPKDDLRVTVDEAYTAFDGAGPALSRLIDSSRPLIELAQAKIGTTRTLLDDAEPVLDAGVDSRADIASFSRDLSSFSEQLVMSDAQVRGVLDNGSQFFDTVSGTLDDVRPTVPLLLANLQTVGEVARVNLPGIRQILVVYPAVSASINYMHRGVQGDDRVYGQGALDVKLGNSANPLPCTEGYQETQRRDPSDLSAVPAPENSYCKLPQADPRVARGARNIPCATNPAVRTAEIADCPGGLPSTWPEMLARPGQPYSPPPSDAGAPNAGPIASQPAHDVPEPLTVAPASWSNPQDLAAGGNGTTSVPYDPVTGNFRAPNGDLYSIASVSAPKLEEELTWQALLLR
ncbi:MCE family protein [Rhodococcus sp. NCIMB 12038]|uniref:MCE family protein n=1 Tax=Rhodococcus sp. NCIMB 12038 TaxID=933800 RepID=UPI000B3CF26C|nr:MlaD family protein [Rhodococcus sp. NCIMB 12038]OUS91638.1 mammalian cell entry protein [Rhodococcus sp. NCIMB 12038]